ncbi:MAG: HPr family phosphocarrier protein [Phycisphaerae bacterium]|nr:HPr family phosphocarrier protein [Phycisphaerae bacterium]
MPKARATITNRLGLHARPAMAFVEKASEFDSEITVRRVDQDECVDGKSIMQMLMLAGTCGTEIELSAEGSDADRALAVLVELVKAGFGEDE